MGKPSSLFSIEPAEAAEPPDPDFPYALRRNNNQCIVPSASQRPLVAPKPKSPVATGQKKDSGMSYVFQKPQARQP
jgi:hypothetical protein